MKNTDKMMNSTRKEGRSHVLLSAALVAAACLPSVATAEQDQSESHYRQINLVSDISGIAQVQDTNLVNAWGISFHPTFPFWTSDNGTGVTTLYAVTNDAFGIAHARIVPSAAIGIPGTGPAVVPIPGDGAVTGQVANNTANFNGDIFLFVTEGGTIAGWRPGMPAAEILASRPSAVYKGVTLATVGTNTVLLAANFREGTVDMYNGNSQFVQQFSDRHAPAGYAPFNVQNLNGINFVTFAKQDADKKDDVPGRGRGLIDVLDVERGRFHRFASGSRAGGQISQMNSPWGLAVAPNSFGAHANQLLVGNFGSGTIMTFDHQGHFHGLLKGTEECPVTIDGLWGLTFGVDGGVSGVSTDLYFTAGPNNESHGLFGVLQVLNEASNDDQE